MLVVDDGSASPPPRASALPRKPLAREATQLHHGLLEATPAPPQIDRRREDHPPGDWPRAGRTSRSGTAGSTPPWRSARLLSLLLALHVLPFAVRPALIGGDEPHYALMAHSLAVDRDVDLRDDYAAVLEGSSAAGRKRAGQALEPHLLPRDGRHVFSHPLGLPAMAAPLVWLQSRLLPSAAPDLLLAGATLAITFLALLAGWSLLDRHMDDRRGAAFVALGLYLSTPLWYYSRTFLTEPYAWSFLVLALAALAARRGVLASAALGCILLLKESGLLLVAPVLLYAAARRGWREAARLALGPLAAGGLWLAKNVYLHGEPWVTFQPFQLGSPLAGALILLVGPASGLLWFAPLALLGALGWLLPGAWRGSDRLALAAAAAAVLGTLGLIAAWADPAGGSSFGPRLAVPALPLFALPLSLLWMRARPGGALRRTAVVVSAAGFTVQWCAALNPVPAMWSIDVLGLLARQPLATASGPLVAAALIWLVPRLLASRPIPSPRD